MQRGQRTTDYLYDFLDEAYKKQDSYTVRELIRLAEESGIEVNATTLNNLICRLARCGALHRIGRGKYTKVTLWSLRDQRNLYLTVDDKIEQYVAQISKWCDNADLYLKNPLENCTDDDLLKKRELFIVNNEIRQTLERLKNLGDFGLEKKQL